MKKILFFRDILRIVGKELGIKPTITDTGVVGMKWNWTNITLMNK